MSFGLRISRKDFVHDFYYDELAAGPWLPAKQRSHKSQGGIDAEDDGRSLAMCRRSSAVSPMESVAPVCPLCAACGSVCVAVYESGIVGLPRECQPQIAVSLSLVGMVKRWRQHAGIASLCVVCRRNSVRSLWRVALPCWMSHCTLASCPVAARKLGTPTLAKGPARPVPPANLSVYSRCLHGRRIVIGAPVDMTAFSGRWLTDSSQKA